MSSAPLQHLILDPAYGYLYPHRQAIAALGLPNEYQLNKHRPHLTEGQHWHRIRGSDHIDRIFYSLLGLERLSQLVATPEAQALWQSVQQHTQPGGALVQVQPAVLYREPDPVLSQPTATQGDQEGELSHLLAIALTPSGSTLPWPTAPPATPPGSGANSHPSTLTPQETAALIFKAQEVLGEQLAKHTRPSDRHPDQNQPTRHEITIWQKWDGYLATQDGVAIGIVYALLCLLLGFAAYYAVDTLRQPPPTAAHQPVQAP